VAMVRSAWQVVRDHRRAYLTLNAMYYGLVGLAMVYVALFDPSLQGQLLADVKQALSQGTLAMVGGAYLGGNLVVTATLTFLVNLFAGSVLYVTLPSLIVPFAGIPLGAYRAVLWGLVLAPTTRELALVMIPHSVTLLLEGQAYVLAIFAAYMHGLAFLRPEAVGLSRHREGYAAGLKTLARVYLLVVIVLAAAAAYEAVEVVTMMRLGAAVR
jgi:hypothetical protein